VREIQMISTRVNLPYNLLLLSIIISNNGL
jgi:hypothetical protein